MKRAARVRRRRVAGNVGTFGRLAEDLHQREAVRPDVHLVMRQQQRAVDVEEDEPRQIESTASRSVRTYAASASGPSSATSTAREPTTMPSASRAAARACSGVEIPKPAYSDTSVTSRARATRCDSSGDTSF